MRMTEEQYLKLTGQPAPPATSSLLTLDGYGGNENRGSQRANKFGAQPKEVDGIVFQSTKEADRYTELQNRVMAGEISDLKWQVSFRLYHAEKYLTTYIADFTYQENGELVVEDCKGFKDRRSPVYRLFLLKKRLMQVFLGIDVQEV